MQYPAISGQGCHEKPNLSHDGEYWAVASQIIIFPKHLENPYVEADSLAFVCAICQLQIYKTPDAARIAFAPNPKC